MICEAKLWLRYNGSHIIQGEHSIASHSCINIPNAEQIIIAATGQLLSIGAPLQPANLLSMSLIRANDALIGRYANVIIMNERVDRAARKNAAVSWVPRERAYPAVMLIFISPYLLKLVGVPQVHLPARGANRKDRAG
jgi:hypothetical protein